MQGNIPAARLKLIERIAARAAAKQKRVGKIGSSAFVSAYFRGVAEEDLSARDVADLAGAALAHLKFGTTRKRSAPLVRVYSPEDRRGAEGFRSTHTIVDVIADDMPFLVDSLGIVFASLGLAVHLTVHPVLRLVRDRSGALIRIADDQSDGSGGRAESWQHIEVDRLPDAAACAALERRLLTVLADVQKACGDWPAMRERARNIAQELRALNAKREIPDLKESAALLDWLADDHFTFLGYREFRLSRGTDNDLLEPIPETSLGILRGRTLSPRTVELTGTLQLQARAPEAVFVTKANTRSTIHRGTYLDYIGAKRFDAKGNVIGERRFLGLFTSSVYQIRPREIPLLRAKIAHLIDRFGLAPSSHDGKAIAHVLDTYPRDELFQASTDDLMESVRGIVNLYERAQVRVFVRRDRFQRYYSCLLFVPRDRYNTQVRQRIEAIVLESLNGTAVESQISLSDSALARVHLLVRSRTGDRMPVTTTELEKRITAAVRTWFDTLRDALIVRHGEPKGLSLSRQFANAFPPAYQSDVAIEDAVIDIDQLQPLLAAADGIELRLIVGEGTAWRLRVLRSGAPVALSDALPLLENLGLRVLTERPYCIALGGERAVWIQDFELEVEGVRLRKADAATRLTIAANFREAYLAIDSGRAENDGFNRLVLAAGLSWRSVSLLRAYAKYVLQTGMPFSQRYMEATLLNHPEITADLWRLFEQRFDPSVSGASRNPSSAAIEKRLRAALDRVQAQDEDRILRAFLTAIGVSLRTNFFQIDSTGRPKEYISIKLDSQRIADLPLPKPLVEIFVYAPRVEGIHLRMGRVARGGLRWSDRREDFRTEVLGLMKAQNVKNTVIVPMGAKGGFVPKRLTAGMSNDDRQREGVACYRMFIGALLDITDNSIGGKVVPPKQVVRHDADDPYLVVAADKGTATFSDIANAVAADYNFWLGDAFASGGSAGYDHKKMAITARGGWECVKRHFREIGVDTQSQDFTAIGVGDMSGDVFGNGMLRSPHIRLLAAFDHRHIFLDPNPDAAASFAERERLFVLPRSSWEDYNARLLSTGGGIHSRAAKSIKLTPAVRSMLGVSEDSLTPQAMMRAILCTPADLFWNGGIGTYVKASGESHAQVGDRANDSVRVDGRDLRCKVVGEGGNLGFTQRGRIEYAASGGRINTDFIDNSAGVDCSDHEVNIKILLNSAMERGLKIADRNKLLARMTEDVGELVLRDNFLQSQALSMMQATAPQRLQEHAHFIRTLELAGVLDRRVEFLPSIEELAERGKAGAALTRPELAVLLSYSKMDLYRRLIDSDVPEDPYLRGELTRYFPAELQKRYSKLFAKHRLSREIIATATTNSMVNRMGPSFTLRAEEDTGANIGQIARAYTIARESFDMRDLWRQVEQLGTRTPAACQYEVLNESARLLRFVTYWLLHRHPHELDIDRQVTALRPGLRALRAALGQSLHGTAKASLEAARERMRKHGLPDSIATHFAQFDALSSGPDLVEVATESAESIDRVAAVYFHVGEALSLDWLRAQILSLQIDGRWQAIARTTLRDQLHSLQRILCLQVLSQGATEAPASAFTQWARKRAHAVEHVKQTINEMKSLATADFATLSVALQSLRQVAG
jgi:glutamate dehydrogenase